jgi:hypothetical protein
MRTEVVVGEAGGDEAVAGVVFVFLGGAARGGAVLPARPLNGRSSSRLHAHVPGAIIYLPERLDLFKPCSFTDRIERCHGSTAAMPILMPYSRAASLSPPGGSRTWANSTTLNKAISAKITMVPATPTATPP